MKQPRDLSKLPNFQNIYKGAERYGYSESDEMVDKSDRWFTLFIQNQKEKQLSPEKFKEFMELSNELAWEDLGEDEYSEGGLIAPNGKPSNLTPEQYKLVRTPEFKEWFGDWENNPEGASKVIDENGEPLVVYHGSRSEFTVFDIGKSGQSNTNAKVGFWFTPILNFAKNWVGSIWYGESENEVIYYVFLSVKNPKIYESEIITEEQKDKLKLKISDLKNESRSIEKKYKDDWDYNAYSVLQASKRGSINEENYNDYLNLSNKSEDAINDGILILEINKKIKNLENKLWGATYTDSYEKFRTDIYKEEGKTSYEANTGGVGMSLSNPNLTIKKYLSSLKNKGFDGIIIKNTRFDKSSAGGLNNQYVAFESNQIKLADGTNTTFDSENPDIRFDGGGSADKMDYKAQEYIDMLDALNYDPNNPKKERLKKYADILLNKYGIKYEPESVRYAKENEVLDKYVGQRYITTDKGLELVLDIYKRNIERTLGIDAYNNGNYVGGLGFSIDLRKGQLRVGGASVKEEYQRKGVYRAMIDFLVKIANDNNLKFYRYGRSDMAQAFWKNYDPKENLQFAGGGSAETNIVIRKIKDKDIPEIRRNIADVLHKTGMNTNEIWSIIGDIDKNISIVAEYNNELAGFYIFREENIPIIDVVDSRFENKDGVEGVVLGVFDKFKNKGVGKKLIEYSQNNLNYDYIWGYQLKSLDNINDWLKRRDIYWESPNLYITYQMFVNGGSTETKYQFRDIGGGIVYYKKENGGLWQFIEKDEFDANANENNIELFNSEEMKKVIVTIPYSGLTRMSAKLDDVEIELPKNERQFDDWAFKNKFPYNSLKPDYEGDTADYGAIYEIPLNKYTEYIKNEKKKYSGGELKRGTATEMEHKDTIEKLRSGNYTIKEGAEMIAKDHLKESDKYYTHLAKMESKFDDGGYVIDEDIVSNNIQNPVVGMAVMNKNAGQFDSVKYVLDVFDDGVRVGDDGSNSGIGIADFRRQYRPATQEEVNRSKQMSKSLFELIFKNGGEMESFKQMEAEQEQDMINLLKSMGIQEPENADTYEYKTGGQTPAQQEKIAKVMGEFKRGELNTSYGTKVTDEKQAIAIALSEAGVEKKEEGGLTDLQNKINYKSPFPDLTKKERDIIMKNYTSVFEQGGVIEGQLHTECNDESGCGEKFDVGGVGNIIEAERDEAVIVSRAFQDRNKYKITGTPSQIASALNVMGGGINFDSGAIIDLNGRKLYTDKIKKETNDTDVKDDIESGSVIINRRSMYDDTVYEVYGTPKQIASAINSVNGYGVVIENGATIKEARLGV